MLDGFIGSDLFYLLFGLSYITLAGTVLLYLRDLNRLKERVNVLKRNVEKIESKEIVDYVVRSGREK